MRTKARIGLPVLLVLVLSLFCGCGGSESETASCSAAELGKKIVESGIAFPELVEVNEENFQLRYALTGEDYDEFCVYWAGSGADADEVCIIRAKDGKTDTVKRAVQARLDAQKTAYQDYVPAQYDRLCQTQVTVRGDYVFWVVSADNQKALEVFNAAF